MVDVLVNVHGSPGKSDHTRPKLVLHVVEVRAQDHGGDRDDFSDDTVVLGEGPVKLIIESLELLLLEESNLGRLRNLNSHAIKALSLADELENFMVEVDVELAIIRVANDEGSLKPRLGLVDRLDPSLVPQVLKSDECTGNLVVHLDDPLGVLPGEHVLIGLELLHGLLDTLQEVTRPGDVTGDGGKVARNWGIMLLFLVKLLDRLKLHPVILEDDVELGVKVRLKGLTLKNCLKLVKQVEGLLDGNDVLEGLVDELLKGTLKVRDANIELDIITVKLVVVVVKEVVRLGAELLLNLVETIDERFHPLKFVLRERRELLNG
mmetsp:Transcript_23248/g.48265  ORF Transcript_23248/g.48265 Transcript_23248/m.48265 type:complete len:321 (-) Transcript_23248:1451-2413(-)